MLWSIYDPQSGVSIWYLPPPSSDFSFPFFALSWWPWLLDRYHKGIRHRGTLPAHNQTDIPSPICTQIFFTSSVIGGSCPFIHLWPAPPFCTGSNLLLATGNLSFLSLALPVNWIIPISIWLYPNIYPAWNKKQHLLGSSFLSNSLTSL